MVRSWKKLVEGSKIWLNMVKKIVKRMQKLVTNDGR